MKNNQQIITTRWQKGASRRITDLATEKGDESKKQAPSNQAQWKPNSKSEQLVGYRTDFGTWGQHTNLNCYNPLREELTKQLPLKDKRKKPKKSNSTQPPGKTTTELLLKYQHQD
jgi:vancomycin resistance protein YoaR